MGLLYLFYIIKYLDLFKSRAATVRTCFSNKQHTQYTYNVILKRVRVTIVAVKNQ